MRSLAARLSITTNEERTELKTEIRDCLGTIGLNLKTLHKMKKLDNLVCEVNNRFPYSIVLTDYHFNFQLQTLNPNLEAS